MKNFGIFFASQALSYCVLTINFRAVAAANVPVALITDGLNASIGFFLIRRIAKSEDSKAAFAGYLAGSLLGTALGIWLS